MATVQPEWIEAAQAAEAETGIPASVTLAQFILESGWGAHIPANSNNAFGVKAVAGQPYVSEPTHEYVGGRLIPTTANFAVYPTLADAFIEHDYLLATSSYYANARACLPNVDDFCNALTGVYSTSPAYGSTLIELIDEHNLTQYDKAQTA